MSDLKSSDTKSVITCPGCAKRFEIVDNSIFGKRVTCKTCRAPFIVDGSVLTEFKSANMPKPKAPEFIDASKAEAVSSSGEREVRRLELIEKPNQIVSPTMKIDESPRTFQSRFFSDCLDAFSILNMAGTRALILIPILFGMGMANDFKNNSLYFMSMWFLQLIFCTACGWVCTYKNLRVILLFACMSPFLWVYTAQTAYLEARWKSQNGADQVDVTDSTWRWGNKVFYRDITLPRAFSTEGPIADSGSVHGKWKTLYYNPIRSETEYFWYGDKVTEGEWHLRNKR